MAQIFKLKGEVLGVWDLDDLTLKEAFVIKATTGMDPAPILQGLQQGSPQAWQAVVWFLMQKQNPGLPLSAVDFRYGDIEIEDVQPQEVAAGDRPTPEVVDSASSGTTTSTSSPAGADFAPAMSTP